MTAVSRPLLIAFLALAAGVLGSALTLVVGATTGFARAGTTTRVEVPVPQRQPRPVPAPASLTSRPGAPGLDAERLYAARASGVVTIVAYFGSEDAPSEVSQGSGFVTSGSGTVLTSAHVITNAGRSDGSVTGADSVFVEFSDNDRVPARVVGWDVFDDVGVLRVTPGAHELDPVPLGDSSGVHVGEPVAAIGSPFGNESSLAVGVVSARRSIDALTSQYSILDAIQTDTPINHGNSGGPLFDAAGRVVGINAQIRSDSSGNFEGVGFAVPINSAKRSLRQLLSGGRVAYAYVGITTDDITPTVARHFGFPARRGALIEQVLSGTTGARAGLRGGTREELFNGLKYRTGGDLILAIDGYPVRNSSDVVRIVAERLRPGALATFTVVRGTDRRAIKVRMGERPARPPRE